MAPSDDEPTETSALLPKTPSTNKPSNTATATASPTHPDATDNLPPPNKVDTNASWPAVAGLPPRKPTDENLVIFRRAVGINYHLAGSDPGTMEQGRRTAIGIYAAVLRARHRKSWQHFLLSMLVYICHFAQIIIGAALTALGPLASHHGVIITVLGALNTTLAGLLALFSGQGLPDRVRKDEIEFRKIQDWIEETESLLSVGIIGRNRKEVGLLVEEAFKKYNAAKGSEENNNPDSYVRQAEEPSRAAADDDSEDRDGTHPVALPAA
jgi:hypothetical protein